MLTSRCDPCRATPLTRAAETSSSARATIPASASASSRLPDTCATPETLPPTWDASGPSASTRESGTPWRITLAASAPPRRIRRRSEDRPGRTGPGPLGREDLVEHERAHVQVGPGDAALPVEPAEGGLGVPLGELLSVHRDVAQVALGVDGNEASAACVLRTAERDVHVGACRHRRVQALEARIVVQREHRQDVAQAEARARADGVDDEALRAPEAAAWRSAPRTPTLAPLGAHVRDVDLGLGRRRPRRDRRSDRRTRRRRR